MGDRRIILTMRAPTNANSQSDKAFLHMLLRPFIKLQKLRNMADFRKITVSKVFLKGSRACAELLSSGLYVDNFHLESLGDVELLGLEDSLLSAAKAGRINHLMLTLEPPFHTAFWASRQNLAMALKAIPHVYCMSSFSPEVVVMVTLCTFLRVESYITDNASSRLLLMNIAQASVQPGARMKDLFLHNAPTTELMRCPGLMHQLRALAANVDITVTNNSLDPGTPAFLAKMAASGRRVGVYVPSQATGIMYARAKLVVARMKKPPSTTFFTGLYNDIWAVDTNSDLLDMLHDDERALWET
jgi:hypothetical protein